MILDSQSVPLQIVDGLQLDSRYRGILRPAETVTGPHGMEYELPRYFYRVDSAELANELRLSPHFQVGEFLDTDFKEAELLRSHPKFIPIAVVHTAAVLELIRRRVEATVRIACNGGYRSPQHSLNGELSAHCWGTAANIYKIGNKLLDSQQNIEEFSEVIRNLVPGVWLRPYGTAPGTSFDHLHMDLGFTVVTPRPLP